MRLVDYLDKGISVAADQACLTTGEESLTYREVGDLSGRIASALVARGVEPGASVAILSANDPVAFATVFGISRAGAVWCPVNPRNEAAENRELLERFDCEVLVHQAAFTGLVDAIAPDLPGLHTIVCLDGERDGSHPWADFLAGGQEPVDRHEPDDIAMIVGTGGTTGRPKGVVLTHQNLETMTALTLMGYPIGERPVYLAVAPLTHAAGVLCFPMLVSGGEIVIARTPDVDAILDLVPRHGVTHLFLPPTLVYMLLDAPALDTTDLSSLRCFWYGAAPMSVARLTEAIDRVGPVMAQLFGQTEAPMMLTMLPPDEHVDEDGAPIPSRLSSAGRAAPLVTLAIVDEHGVHQPTGERGEIVVRSSLVMRGYYRDPEATAAATIDGWHRTGDIGYLDEERYLHIVDRAKDMIITGGFNVYSAEVEQALMRHPAVQDCAVVGRPDERWGERVVAVVQLRPGRVVDPSELRSFVRAEIGGVKAPKELHLWDDLPRSKVGKVVKPDVRARLDADPATPG
ncbi:MAG: long-chain fatty acid--CoA ligase [Propionibacteriales bacterium]|nr:long-chain fatty acid--CoA ligase [Propionibacteriales bacterium]